jgi:hypothetical protein
VDSAINLATTAIEKMGPEFIIKTQIESDEYWHPHHQSISYKATLDKLMDPKYEAIIDWFFAVFLAPHEMANWIHDMACMIQSLHDKHSLQAAILFLPMSAPLEAITLVVEMLSSFATTITNVEWQVIYKRLNNTNFGGRIETEHTMIVFAP